MFRSMFLRVAAFLGIAAACSCTKEEIKTEYSRQEKNIESFINSTLTSIDTANVVQNKVVSRVVVAPGIEGDSLKLGGKVTLYYSGFVLKSSSLSRTEMFATNSREEAAASQWPTADDSMFGVKTIDTSDKDVVEGLRYGLVGVKPEQECYIAFSGKHGFGKKPLGTIPANAALVYHVWVENISNK